MSPLVHGLQPARNGLLSSRKRATLGDAQTIHIEVWRKLALALAALRCASLRERHRERRSQQDQRTRRLPHERPARRPGRPVWRRASRGGERAPPPGLGATRGDCGRVSPRPDRRRVVACGSSMEIHGFRCCGFVARRDREFVSSRDRVSGRPSSKVAPSWTRHEGSGGASAGLARLLTHFRQLRAHEEPWAASGMIFSLRKPMRESSRSACSSSAGASTGKTASSPLPFRTAWTQSSIRSV